jgi:Domain of unknown function (DUF4259)
MSRLLGTMLLWLHAKLFNRVPRVHSEPMYRIITLLFASLLSLLSLAAIAGARGEGSFENDDAVDWIAECIQTVGGKMIVEAFTTANDAKYLEAPDGAAAVVAAEIVAAAQGKASPSFPKGLAAWLAQQPRLQIAALTPLAMQALKKVRDPKASELKQLWSEGKKNTWEQKILELERRIGGQ